MRNSGTSRSISSASPYRFGGGTWAAGSGWGAVGTGSGAGRVGASGGLPRMPPEAAERFVAAIPNATLGLLDGVGHHVELEAPDRVADAIRTAVGPN